MPTAKSMSRPARARGLKPLIRRLLRLKTTVAPRAGAWIETSAISGSPTGILVAPRAGAWIETRRRLLLCARTLSRPARARGLKPGDDLASRWWRKSRPARARGLKHHPRAAILQDGESRPARARGLKRLPVRLEPGHGHVAPRAGAWIETTTISTRSTRWARRAPRGRVD